MSLKEYKALSPSERVAAWEAYKKKLSGQNKKAAKRPNRLTA